MTVPTLSQIQTWDTDHLRHAADYWGWAADHWETVFTTVYQASAQPGGHPWEGSAADQAQLRAYLDRMAVIGVADQIRAAADAARTGAPRIDAARRKALDVVKEAIAAGFEVGQDLSVSYPHRVAPADAAARQQQAEQFAARIRTAAIELMTVDNQVAAAIAESGAGVESLDFGAQTAVAPHLNDITSPPADSLKGGGYWSVDTSKGYDEPGTVMGPLAPWERTIDADDANPALTGKRSPFADVAAPNYPGAGAEPVARLLESWQFRLVGESFNGSQEHLRWVRENGKWYQARWIDYRFTGIQQRALTSEQELLAPLDKMGFAGRPQPLSIQDIYRISAQNTRLTLSIPDICGKPVVIGSDAPSTAMPGAPMMRAPR